MVENKINVGGRLHSIATGNVLAGANEIFDDEKNKKQSEINTETYTLVNEVNAKLDSLSPEQQGALDVATKANKNEANLGYYVCSTEENVAAKVISDATGYILSKGGSMKVKMTNTNTAANATLNINSTGAKPLYYDSKRASANNSWEAGETIEVYYDGTSYYANNVAYRIADGTVVYSKLSTDIQSLISNLSKNALYAGIATSTTNPGTPDGPVFYIANGRGTYANFDGLEVTEDEVIFLYYDTAWHKVSTRIPSQEKLSKLESETKELITNQSVSGHPYYMIVDGTFSNYDAASKTVNILSQYNEGKLKLYKVNGGERIFAKTDYRCPIYILKDFNFDKSTYTKVDGYNLGFVAELTEGTQGVGQFEYIIPSDAKYVAITHYKSGFAPYDFLYINDHRIEETILDSVKSRKNGIFNIKTNYVRANYFGTNFYAISIYHCLSGIKDIYIPNRDVNKHYFISHIYAMQGDLFQFKIAYTEDGVMCKPSDYTVIFSVNLLKSSISEDDRKKIYVIEQNGIKLAVVFNELIQNRVNFGSYEDSINPFSNKDFVEIDWDYVDTHSMFTKQDTLVSGTNIKTINSQSLLGSGNIEIESVTDYSSLENKPSINNIPLLGNKSLSDLSIQPKLISGNNIKTINGQSILGNGNVEIESGVADYNDLANKPTFKTVNGQLVLGSGNIQSAESITNFPDNITIEEVNSVLRLKDLSGSSYKYGYKHIYNDITISRYTDISSWSNSIVEIKGTITLTGTMNINIPDNCILYFNGGSIKNGDFTAKLYPHSAKIIASPYQIFFGDIRISTAYGNDLFYADVAYGEWFGAKGDGVTPDGWAFAKLTSAINCNKIQLLRKTYILERGISVISSTLSGYGSTLKRYSKFADVLITEPTVVKHDGTHVLTVDTNADTYSNLEVGMAVFIMNKSTDSRQVVGGRWVISNISGSSVTIVGNTIDAVYAANTMCLVTGFNLVNLYGRNSRVEGIKLDGLLNLASPIYPLDRTPWEADCTIGGGYDVENASIEDCYIINSLADAIMVGGKNNIFSHNTILHSGANGIHLSGNYIVHIDNNYIFDSNLNPLTLHNEGAITYSNNIFEVTITNNIFDNCLAGIGSIDSADDCKSIITGNIFRNFRTHGIQGNATNTSYGNITRQFIISNNRFIATQDDAASWESSYLYSPNIPRQEATGYGILLDEYGIANWDSIIINNNNFEDCGICIKYALSAMFSNNLIRIEHNFASSTPNDIIQLINSNGAAQNNVIKSNSQSKTNCFKLTNSKVLVSGNAYNLTGCSLSDTTYELLKDNTDIS